MARRRYSRYRSRRGTRSNADAGGCGALLVIAFVAWAAWELLNGAIGAFQAAADVYDQVMRTAPWVVYLGILGIGATVGGGTALWLRWRGAKRARAVLAYQQRIAHETYERQQQLLHEEQARRQRLARLRTLKELLSLTPTEFERAVGDILEAHGYRDMKRTGGAGDLHADLTCLAPDGRSVVVQCKRYDPEHRIGSPEMQTFFAMVTGHHKADLGLYVTTSSYTDPATEFARQHTDKLELWDGSKIVRLMRNVR